MEKIKCALCGKEYEYCPNCAEFKYAPSWKAEYDTENCKDIWLTINKFAFNHITKEEALNELKNKDLSLKKLYPADVQKVLAKIQETTFGKVKKEVAKND